MISNPPTSEIVRDKEIPGTNGILDLSRYLDDGYRLITFLMASNNWAARSRAVLFLLFTL